MRVSRFDKATILDSQESDYGFLTIECVITKTGVMDYLNSDGELVKEAKLPEHVFDEDTIESAKGVPATKEHPTEFPVDTSNYKEHMKGMTHTNVVKENDEFLVVSTTVFDETLIEEIKSGERQEISIGFECDIEEEEGTFNGTEYDAIQKNIKINHIAFTKEGRAGSEVKARLDSNPNLSVMQPNSTQPVMNISGYKNQESKNLDEKKFWEIRKDSEDNVGELRIYGQIVNLKLWEEEVSATSFRKEMEALEDVNEINLYINSPGGSVFSGQAINTLLKRHDAIVNVYIDGLAASIASVIAMAGDNVYMPKNAMLMIHQPMSGVWGNAEEMRQEAELLDKITKTAIATYQEKTNLEEDELVDMMDNETWLTGEEALDLGFIDKVETFNNLKTAELDSKPVTEKETNKEDSIMTIKFDGKELNEEEAQEKLDSLQSQVEDLQKEKNTLDADLTAKKKELENAEGTIQELKKDLEEQPDADELMEEKLELYAEVIDYVPQDVIEPTDTKEDMKLAVIAQFDEDFDGEDKNQDWIDAYFESAKKALDKTQTSSFVIDQSGDKDSKSKKNSFEDAKKERLKNN